MTNQEAIVWMKDELRLCSCGTEKSKALRLAIAALKEKQAKEESQKRDDELFRILRKKGWDE